MTSENLQRKESTTIVTEPSPKAEGSQIYSVRLPASASSIVEAVIKLHYMIQHIPQPTASEYLKYIIMQDTQRMIDEAHLRRSKITG